MGNVRDTKTKDTESGCFGVLGGVAPLSLGLLGRPVGVVDIRPEPRLTIKRQLYQDPGGEIYVEG